MLKSKSTSPNAMSENRDRVTDNRSQGGAQGGPNNLFGRSNPYLHNETRGFSWNQLSQQVLRTEDTLHQQRSNPTRGAPSGITMDLQKSVTDKTKMFEQKIEEIKSICPSTMLANRDRDKDHGPEGGVQGGQDDLVGRPNTHLRKETHSRIWFGQYDRGPLDVSNGANMQQHVFPFSRKRYSQMTLADTLQQQKNKNDSETSSGKSMELQISVTERTKSLEPKNSGFRVDPQTARRPKTDRQTNIPQSISADPNKARKPIPARRKSIRMKIDSELFKEPAQLIFTDETGELRCNEHTPALLHEINYPLNVVAITGLYRTGKSYLLNRLAGVKTGFNIGGKVHACTKGIWIWCRHHPSDEDQVLVLLDVEGFGDTDKVNRKEDTWLFTLATLLSSSLVYNNKGTLDAYALDRLKYLFS